MTETELQGKLIQWYNDSRTFKEMVIRKGNYEVAQGLPYRPEVDIDVLDHVAEEMIRQSGIVPQLSAVINASR